MAISPKDIDILQLAHNLKLEIGSKRGSEVEVKCPFCDDSKYHMSLNTSKNIFRCNRCGEGGGVLHLYAKINNCSTKTAYEEIIKQNFPKYEYKTPKENNDSNIIKPLKERNEVYKELLKYLVLADRHKMDLLRRGLRRDIIEKNQYKSIPQIKGIRTEICRKLTSNYELKGIPGFFQDKYTKEWDFYSVSGYMIPLRNKDNKIQGFQIRKDNLKEGERKFKYFSTSAFYNGTRTEGYIHLVGNNYKELYITEGPLKGDIVNHISKTIDGIDRTFVCLPGINATKHLAATLNDLGTEKVCLTIDMDKIKNMYVLKALVKINEIIRRETDIKKIIEFNWEKKYLENNEIKGIDDYMYHMKVAK